MTETRGEMSLVLICGRNESAIFIYNYILYIIIYNYIFIYNLFNPLTYADFFLNFFIYFIILICYINYSRFFLFRKIKYDSVYVNIERSYNSKYVYEVETIFFLYRK